MLISNKLKMIKKNKNVVTVYFGNDWSKETPLLKDEPTRISFEYWHKKGLEQGVQMYRASIKWYNKDKNIFEKAWAYRDGKWMKITEPIKPDMIFDKIAGKYDYQLFDFKMDLIAKNKVKFFNHPIFRVSTDNKLTQYLVLKEFMPDSFLATNEKELGTVLNKIKTTKVVVKPLHGSGGFGIIIDKKNNIKNKEIKYPVFVQEFIKSEKGIPGFSKKDEVADLRMIYINNKCIYSLSRIAKKGSLFTNFHQGASVVLVPENKIPESVKKMAGEIVKKLSVFPEANYSLDFVFTNEGNPILIEMNTTPGLDLLHIVGDEKIKQKNFEEFIKIL